MREKDNRITHQYLNLDMVLKHLMSLCIPEQHLLPSSQAGMQLNPHKYHWSKLEKEGKQMKKERKTIPVLKQKIIHGFK